MYARMIEIRTKGHAKDLARKMADQALPILKKQSGFVDAVALTSDNESDQFVGITIWNSKQDAEKYTNGPGRQVLESLNSQFQGQPTFRGFNLEASTFHNIGLSRAASS